VVVVDDLAAARSLLADRPALRAVTRDGDLLGTHWAAGGSTDAQSYLEVQAAVDEAASSLEEARHRGERARFALAQVSDERQRAAETVEKALARLHESDAELAAVTEQLGQLGSSARAAEGEAERLETSITQAREALEADQQSLADLAGRLESAEAAEPEDDGDAESTEERDRLSQACTEARQAEMEARLAVRTAEERARSLSGRADGLERAARQEREARARAAARRERRARDGAVAAAVERGARAALARVETSVAVAAEEREQAEQARTALDTELTEVRNRSRALASEVEKLTDAVHKDEVARAEQRMRIEQLETRAVEELGVEPETLVAEYGPDQPVPPVDEAAATGGRTGSDTADGASGGTEGSGGGAAGSGGGAAGSGGAADEEPPPAVPYVREEQEKRLKKAERGLAQLGKINPLALEEYAALEERHQFLGEQLEDLKATRRDLLTVIREVDERVEQVFTEAFHDTAREFTDVFGRLFPGGEGRLVLTDPSDMLTTGIEVEARPPGKKVKRLSLLSGGERSLTAIALLIAIFKARPSPFYVLDEVEAALDDTNLQRLLGILSELRESSQLIVITHQKRTMEIADALYGTSMRGDGVTAVISQRMREAESA
jgi:chromosome segregation protein